MFYKTVVEQMYSVLLTNLYIYRPIEDENVLMWSVSLLLRHVDRLVPPMRVLSTCSCLGN